MGENLTIIDIARLAGVSKSTVSRVLNHEPRVKPETQELVLRVIQENGYFPNEVARTLVKSKSNLIGLITPFQVKSFYRNEFFRDAYTGLSRVFRARAYDMLTSSGSGVELDSIKRFVHTYHVTGIVLLYAIPDDPSLHYLVENQIPFSLIGACDDFDGINQVTYDYRAAMRGVVEEFLGIGRERIALFAGDTGLSTTCSYTEGYRATLERHGLPVNEKYIVGALDEEKEVVAVMKRLKNSGSMPNAVIASDEVICGALIRYCKEEGLRIPEDLALVSLEDGLMSQMLGISSINFDYMKMGELAGTLLIDTLERGHTACVRLNYEILRRTSTGHGTAGVPL